MGTLQKTANAIICHAITNCKGDHPVNFKNLLHQKKYLQTIQMRHQSPYFTAPVAPKQIWNIEHPKLTIYCQKISVKSNIKLETESY